MPADNGSGCHLDERFLPASPALSQYDPEQLVCRSESPARALGVKSQQLLTQGKIFEDEILAGPECTNNPAEEVPEPYDHAQNLTGTLSIELGAKSLILQVYDVLMNDRPQEWVAFRYHRRENAFGSPKLGVEMATAFCFTRVFCGDKLGQSSCEVTNAKALHRAAYFHCVARSSTAACIRSCCGATSNDISSSDRL